MKKIKYIWISAVLLAIAFVPSMAAATEAEFFLTGASPAEIMAGETAVLNITLKNMGTEQALRVRVSLDPADTSPIDPVGPIETQIEKGEGAIPSSFFGAVDQAEEITLSYRIAAKYNATRGTYNVPIKLEWANARAEKRNQTLYSGMILLERPIAVLSIKSIEPDALMPGEQAAMTFTLSNEGQETVKDIFLSWSSSDNALRPLGSTDRAYISSLNHSQSLKIPFKVIANQNATAGIHTLSIALSYYDLNNNQKTASFSSALNILRNPEQEINVKINPLSFKPGEKSDVVFEVSNPGASAVRDIAIVWTAQNNALLPLGSDNRITISTLNPNESVKVPVHVTAGLTYGIYPVSIGISYFDQLNEMRERTISSGAVIGGGTDFEVNLQQSAESSTSFSIGNIGINPATAVTVKVPVQDAYAVIGPSALFLGNLDPGDFSVASFQIAPKGQRGKSLKIEVSYTDTTGERQSVSKEVSIGSSDSNMQGFPANVSRQGFASRQAAGAGAAGNTANTRYILLGLGGLAALGAAYFLWKFLKRKKK